MDFLPVIQAFLPDLADKYDEYKHMLGLLKTYHDTFKLEGDEIEIQYTLTADQNNDIIIRQVVLAVDMEQKRLYISRTLNTWNVGDLVKIDLSEIDLSSIDLKNLPTPGK